MIPRARQGRPGGNLLLLTTVGARTGIQRVTPLAFARDGERYVVAASYAGASKHPAWYHNLVATPKVAVEVGEETFEAVATPVEDRAERDRLYAALNEISPMFGEYQAKTERLIPVVVVERV
ncbi:nitroreductase family deazaflavin-dependent oxidoreductase [Saccharothrix sp.]|uniref:nitroreductase family deazaflavin-dependent oxidoreductase n=1 Tax=Saccharothrix sp. TaxID=1873460 RepID=UPI0035C7EAE2